MYMYLNFVIAYVCKHHGRMTIIRADVGKKAHEKYVQSIDSNYIFFSGFGGLEVACWPLVPKLVGSHPAGAVGFLELKKNPQHAFLRRGSKAVSPMS
jgi:hypothetical protein